MLLLCLRTFGKPAHEKDGGVVGSRHRPEKKSRICPLLSQVEVCAHIEGDVSILPAVQYYGKTAIGTGTSCRSTSTGISSMRASHPGGSWPLRRNLVSELRGSGG